MSGPKTSHYTLTAEQRRILAEQRKIRLERAHLDRLQQDTRSIIVQADRILAQAAPLLEEVRADTATMQEVRALRSEAMAILNLASDLDESSGLSALQEASSQMRAVSGKLQSLSQTLKKKFEDADRTFRSKMTGQIEEGFSFSFDGPVPGGHISDSAYQQKIRDELDAVSELSMTSDQLARLEAIREKASTIHDAGFLKNYYSMTVLPFTKEYRALHALYAAIGEEYERKRSIYEINSRELGITAEEIPFSAEALPLLDARIQETNAAIASREEQAYISRCVDEAMREMGYSVLGDREIVKRNGRRFHNELYLFDEGTAVNVTYSDDGQITMELGGMSMDDRIPTAAESAGLAANMRSFCDDYYEIEKILKKKGIVAKTISHLPPDSMFAQIINVSDYNLCTDVSEYESRNSKRSAFDVKARKIGE